MTTGMVSPARSGALVRALNCLQNSMMLTWAWPSAGPTGGAGVALPAAIWSFTEPVAFFAMMPFRLHSCVETGLPVSAAETRQAASLQSLRHLLHLPKLQLHRGRAPEDRDHDFHSFAIFIDFIHHARKRRERTFANTHSFVLLELDLELRLLPAVGDFVNDVADFLIRQRSGLLPRADESSNARCGLDHVPDMIVHVHFDQHVAGIKHALGRVLFAAANFGDRLGRDQHFADLVLQPESLHARFERFLHFALESRICVDDVPLHIRILWRL